MLRYAITSGEYASNFLTQNPGTVLDAESPPLRPSTVDARAILLRQIAYLISEKVDFIQLREKGLPASETASLAREILAILHSTRSSTRLLLNTRIDIAVATRSHGVHLTSSTGGETPAQVRAIYAAAPDSATRPPPIVSKACHTLADVEAARASQVDLILFSPIFGKGEAPGIGLTALQSAVALAAPRPVLALGGVTLENTSACLQTGAHGVAGIRLFLPPTLH